MITLKLHSVVDLITNSSTTIYTFYDSSVEPCKKMINAFLKTFGVEKTADDMFYIAAFNCVSDALEEEYGNTEDLNLEVVIKNYLEGDMTYVRAFNKEHEDGDYFKVVNIYIIPKKEEYRELGNRIKSLLYSPGNEAQYNG